MDAQREFSADDNLVIEAGEEAGYLTREVRGGAPGHIAPVVIADLAPVVGVEQDPGIGLVVDQDEPVGQLAQGGGSQLGRGGQGCALGQLCNAFKKAAQYWRLDGGGAWGPVDGGFGQSVLPETAEHAVHVVDRVRRCGCPGVNPGCVVSASFYDAVVLFWHQTSYPKPGAAGIGGTCALSLP